jgi:hypothetical protein
MNNWQSRKINSFQKKKLTCLDESILTLIIINCRTPMPTLLINYTGLDMVSINSLESKAPKSWYLVSTVEKESTVSNFSIDTSWDNQFWSWLVSIVETPRLALLINCKCLDIVDFWKHVINWFFRINSFKKLVSTVKQDSTVSKYGIDTSRNNCFSSWLVSTVETPQA